MPELQWWWIREAHQSESQLTNKTPLCIINERSLFRFNLNFHLTPKGIRQQHHAVRELRSGQTSSQPLPGGIYCKGQRLGNNNRRQFSFKRSFSSPDILQSYTFHIHFMEHFIWVSNRNLSPPEGLKSDYFQCLSVNALLLLWRWFCSGSLWHFLTESCTQQV